MRISTSMIYDQGVNSINQQYGDLVKLQQQLSTGRRVLTPADDPIASARALQVAQSQSVNAQYMLNGQHAQSSLELEESVLTQVTGLLQDARVLAVNAGNPSLSDSDRTSLAVDLQGRYAQLLGLANTTDGNGLYLFSGYKGTTQPFSETGSGGVSYNGDQGQRRVQVSASRQIAVSSSGAEVFQLIKSGNGTFATAAAGINTGTGIVSQGVVLDAALWNAAGNNQDFTIRFDVTGGATTYDIVDNVTGNSLLTDAAAAADGPYPRSYTSGATIDLKNQGAEPAFDYGVSLSIRGDPADGDSFGVKPSSTQQDIFSTLNALITALNTPVSGSSAGNTRLTNDLNTALSNLDLALDNVLSVRATVGATLKEIDAHRATGEDLDLQYSGTLSDLQDLDYAKAISDMTLKQSSLEAAQQSFLRVQGLSLFNYL